MSEISFKGDFFVPYLLSILVLDHETVGGRLQTAQRAPMALAVSSLSERQISPLVLTLMTNICNNTTNN